MLLNLLLALNQQKPPKRLEIGFEDCKFSPPVLKLLLNNKKLLTSLKIMGDCSSKCNDNISVKYAFKHLESLTLSGGRFPAVLLRRHAKQLKSLKVIQSYDFNFKVSDLPVLESLEVIECGSGWSLLEACRQSITYLGINDSFNETPPLLYNGDPNISERYQVSNIKHLRMVQTNYLAFNFVLKNAKNLVSLDLMLVDADLPVGTDNMIHTFKWPEFSSLRVLKFDDLTGLLILRSCKDSLECLVCVRIEESSDTFKQAMPSLTDLYLHYGNQKIMQEILSNKHSNLEFLLLHGFRVPEVEDSTPRMEALRIVVLICEQRYPSRGARLYGHYDYTEQDRERMERLCPNAQVIIVDSKNWKEIRRLIKGRCQRKDYRLDVENLFFCTYINKMN